MVSERHSKTIKFLCSYNGKILPRRSDGKLRYVGGFTRVLAADRSITFAELMVKLVEFCGFSVTLKCQLPNSNLEETLITVRSDEELALVVEEYDQEALKLCHDLKIRAILLKSKSLKQVSPPPSSAHSAIEFSVFGSLQYTSSGDHCSCVSCRQRARSYDSARYEAMRGYYGSPRAAMLRVPQGNRWY